MVSLLIFIVVVSLEISDNISGNNFNDTGVVVVVLVVIICDFANAVVGRHLAIFLHLQTAGCGWFFPGRHHRRGFPVTRSFHPFHHRGGSVHGLRSGNHHQTARHDAENRKKRNRRSQRLQGSQSQNRQSHRFRHRCHRRSL